MHIALTGATGFLGRYIARLLLEEGHALRCWQRRSSNRSGLEADGGTLEWIEGALGEPDATEALVQGCDAVVHSALHHPGGGFRRQREGDIFDFVEKNVLGTLRLIEAARAAGAGRFVFISTCAVHEEILDDRSLDEFHPLFPHSHYGAHKAAIEKFISSYGRGDGYPICSLRPTGIYGLAEPAEDSRWYDLVRAVVHGREVQVKGGGKEVHASDVARAVALLLQTPIENVTGQIYNCYDRYFSEYDVAQTAKQIAGTDANIVGGQREPLHQIETKRIRKLGMEFGGWPLFEQTVGQMVDAVRPGGRN